MLHQSNIGTGPEGRRPGHPGRVASPGERPAISEGLPAAGSVRRSVARRLWMGLGILACGLGFLGVILPGMPATVFFIGAAACFSRSSPRLLEWIENLPRIGLLVRNYRAGRGMPLSAKLVATAMMMGAGALSVGVLAKPWLKVVVVVSLVVGVAVVWWRVPLARGADRQA